ncbi:MAG: nicotinate phosphoribosyltransferase [Bacilli bacterium]|nr:nicotinate phosphoribosyltransferase [Bacilli bacterium]
MKMNEIMSTDRYEFTMGNGYLEEGMKNEIAYFDVFFRRNPLKNGYTIMAGLDQIIGDVENMHFEEEDIEYFKAQGIYTAEFLEYLKNFKFTGDIYAIPDGTPVFPNEPTITVRANLIEAQILETLLLSHFNSASLVATAAKRVVLEAGKPVMEFGSRRTHTKAAIDAGKNAYLAGCSGTSNEATGRYYGVPTLGTMAHSWITAFDNEYEAFLKYAKHNPENTVFLVDTYDVLRSGIPNAIKVANEYLRPNGLPFKGIRIDSGDLAYLSKEARKMLDEAGYQEAKICLSNGLTAETIRDLNIQGAKVDSYGIGDNIAAPLDRLGGVYKLVALEEMGNIVPKIKVSADEIKTINPGYKKVYRFYDKKTGYALGDVVALASERIPKDKFTLVDPTDTWKRTTITNYEVRELQVPIYQNGILVYQEPTLKESREYCTTQMDTLYEEVKRLEKPHQYYVDLTTELLKLKRELIASTTESVTTKEKSIGRLW